MVVSSDPQPVGGDFVRALWRHRGDRGAVHVLLHAAQRERGWVSQRHLELIAAIIDLPMAELDRQVAVRPELRSEPPGSHLVQTCDGLACHLGAGNRLQAVLAQELGIRPGQTTPDGSVTWQVVPCLGACVRAPAMAVDGEIFGPLEPAEAIDLLARVRRGARPAAPPQLELPLQEGRVVRLTGRVQRPSLVRVSPGCTLSELVEDIGGGVVGGAPFKAALCGSRLIPAARGDAPLPPPEPHEAAGHTLQILVLDEGVCVVDLMVLLLDRAAARACGRCTLGRLGTRRMLALALGVQRGGGGAASAELLSLGEQVAAGARCDGCRAPASAVVDALREFPEEVRAHAMEGSRDQRACGVQR